MWRPYLNVTFDGNNGYSLNVTIPSGLSGSVRAIREGEFIIGGTAGKNNATHTIPGTMWFLSLEPGSEGTLIGSFDFTPPETVVPDTTTGGVFGYGLMSLTAVSPEDNVFIFTEAMTRRRWGFDLSTGNMIWGPTDPGPDWDFYGLSTSIYNGKLFSYGYGGELIAYNITTGDELWRWGSGSVGLETFYENAPLNLGCIADGKIYLYSSEHSPSQPLRRDANIWCVNTDNGELLWKIQCWPGNLAIGDGYIIALDLFDNQIYCYGKGPSATTVSAPSAGVTAENSVMITGTVTDQSAGAKDTPAIADEDMEDWMEYMYQQRPKPEGAQGVPVRIIAIDPNGNSHYMDTVSDINGNFGQAFDPPIEGEYQIVAQFEGSNSYGSSTASTYMTVDPAPVVETDDDEPAPPAYTTIELAILAAVIVLIIIALIGLLRKK